MANCCKPVGTVRCYWPGGRCPIDAPLADSVPWTVEEADLVRGTVGDDTGGPGSQRAGYDRATKVVGAVTITARLLNATGTTFFPTPGSTAATSGSPGSSLGVIEWSGSDPIMEFSVSVRQPQVQMKVEDIDSGQGSGSELVRMGFAPARNPGRPSDRFQPYKPLVGPAPPPAAQHFWSANNDFGVNFADENAVLLQWDDQPWGDGTNGAPPVWVQYVNATAQHRGSYFDFGGPIYQEACTVTPRRARLVLCCDEDPQRWIDVETGEDLSADDIATIDLCGPHHG